VVSNVRSDPPIRRMNKPSKFRRIDENEAKLDHSVINRVTSEGLKPGFRNASIEVCRSWARQCG